MDTEREALRRWAESFGGHDRRVILVNGAPGSGKTTWVREQMKKQDLVLDMDSICRALNGGALRMR